MANKKATKSTSTKKKTPTKKPASSASKTKVTTIKAGQTKKTAGKKAANASSKLKNSFSGLKSDSVMSIVLAEFIGTFILTSVAVVANLSGILPLYVGLTLVVLVLGIGAISGSHVNPAVTFGLWTVRKVKTALVPFYWGAQILGAMAAFILTSMLSSGVSDFFGGKGPILSFDHFASFNWNVFTIEMIGAAIFLFGLTAVISNKTTEAGAKAVGVGMSLLVALIVTLGLFNNVMNGVDQSGISVKLDQKTGQQKLVNIPHEMRVGGATLNPAVALAVTEQTDSQIQGVKAPQKGEKHYTRLSLEVILATLIGAAIGSNLAVMIGRKN